MFCFSKDDYGLGGGVGRGLGVGANLGVGVGRGVDVAAAVAVAVPVGVGVPPPAGSLSKKVSCWDEPAMGTRPSTHAETWSLTNAEA